MSRSYLVTGGCGFIGSHLVEALVAKGDSVRVLDDLSKGSRKNIALVQSDVDLVVGDVRNIETVQLAMQDIDIVVHEAAIASVSDGLLDPLRTHEVNVTGTLNVLITARDLDIQRVVIASSSAVYGDVSIVPISE